jgi:hypothetical protein
VGFAVNGHLVCFECLTNGAGTLLERSDPAQVRAALRLREQIIADLYDLRPEDLDRVAALTKELVGANDETRRLYGG